nr:MAG TPA: hypothetical protein [Caudoviricetes sp.]
MPRPRPKWHQAARPLPEKSSRMALRCARGASRKRNRTQAQPPPRHNATPQKMPPKLISPSKAAPISINSPNPHTRIKNRPKSFFITKPLSLNNNSRLFHICIIIQLPVVVNAFLQLFREDIAKNALHQQQLVV